MCFFCSCHPYRAAVINPSSRRIDISVSWPIGHIIQGCCWQRVEGELWLSALCVSVTGSEKLSGIVPINGWFFVLFVGLKVAFKLFPEGLLTGTPPISVSGSKSKTIMPASGGGFTVDDIDKLEIYLDNSLQDKGIGSELRSYFRTHLFRTQVCNVLVWALLKKSFLYDNIMSLFSHQIPRRSSLSSLLKFIA